MYRASLPSSGPGYSKCSFRLHTGVALAQTKAQPTTRRADMIVITHPVVVIAQVYRHISAVADVCWWFAFCHHLYHR